jgi:N6-adenosine-specific RNA methylase IME4
MTNSTINAATDLLKAIGDQRFKTILADPPWQFQNRTGKMAPEHKRLNRYSTMKLDDILALPVGAIADETSHLYLWVPNALLPEGLRVMEAWGFKYKSNVVWHKIRKDGGPDGRGVGFYFRNVTELLLFGVRGKNARTLQPGRSQVNFLATQKREHSRKPDEMFDIIESCSPQGHAWNYSHAVHALNGLCGAIRLTMITSRLGIPTQTTHRLRHPSPNSLINRQPMNSVGGIIKEYRHEVNIAATSFYVWKNINNLATENSDVFHAVSANALIWNTTTHSLQVTFFVALGRIFDKDLRSLTIKRFISESRDNIQQFSRKALEARRIDEANGVRPEWLDSFLEDVYEPLTSDFDVLEQAVKHYEAIYREKYEPIRHKVIAHKDFATIGSRDALFAVTNIGEIEEILLFLHRAERVVAELYVNGRKTNLTDHTLDEEKYVREDLEDLFRKLSAETNVQ